jgi:hypothetical protein
MFSVATKKRELVGNFKNSGAKWDPSPMLVNDHDFRSDSIGVADLLPVRQEVADLSPVTGPRRTENIHHQSS